MNVVFILANSADPDGMPPLGGISSAWVFNVCQITCLLASKMKHEPAHYMRLRFLLHVRLAIALFVFMLYIPVNNFLVMLGRFLVFLG